MTIQQFKLDHFSTYQSWFLDELVQAHLGTPPDQEWLDYILKEEGGMQYTFFEKQKMIGVMGIVFPDKDHPHYFITDIVVNPKRREEGIGAQMLCLLQDLHPLGIDQSYKAFVDIKNKNAQLFFKEIGWHLEREQPDKDGMLSFILKIEQ